MVSRVLYEKIKEGLFKGKAIVIIGPRQVGKTTLLKELSSEGLYSELWLNADEPDIIELFTKSTSTKLKSYFGNRNLIIIDEAQQIKDIGKIAKLVVDEIPNIQLIMTGSSAFELRDRLNEPLTGRKIEFFLFPFSLAELENHFEKGIEKRMLENRLIFGMYPEVIKNPGSEEGVLRELTSSYLYKDILMIDGIKKASLIDKLLLALALQLGNEVSYRELSQLIGGVDPATVEKYIDLLEKAFVVFKLNGLNRNLRNEIKKGKKIYFWDNGIRNSIIKNFNPLALRNDKGALWENFMISERLKYNLYRGYWSNYYFWRTHDGAEIDFIEEKNGQFYCVEFKWDASKKSIKLPRSFQEAYPNHKLEIVDIKTYETFVGC